jgi:hypothetical protein
MKQSAKKPVKPIKKSTPKGKEAKAKESDASQSDRPTLHSQDIQAVNELLKLGVEADYKEQLKRNLNWLLENPNRVLSTGMRKRMGDVKKTLLASQKPPAPKKRAFVSRKAQMQDDRTKRPAWMDDPSLLPKRPPTNTRPEPMPAKHLPRLD